MAIKIMPCLDMQNGRVVKGVQFVNIRDAGDPVACCIAYCNAGADEIALLDITATVEGRSTMLEVVRKVAEAATVPFTVGGGVSDLASAAAVLDSGADKISTSSAAFRKPDVIREMVKEFGADRITVAIDAAVNNTLPSGYEVYIDGGRTATGADAIEWARKVDGYGVATILPTSKTTDGVKSGYDLPLIRTRRPLLRRWWLPEEPASWSISMMRWRQVQPSSWPLLFFISTSSPYRISRPISRIAASKS